MSKFFSKDGKYLGLGKKNFTFGKKRVIFEGRRNISRRKKMREDTIEREELYIDNDKNTTNKGTEQDVDGRWQKIFQKGVE